MGNTLIMYYIFMTSLQGVYNMNMYRAKCFCLSACSVLTLSSGWKRTQKMEAICSSRKLVPPTRLQHHKPVD
jgi:hypothetical protein